MSETKKLRFQYRNHVYRFTYRNEVPRGDDDPVRAWLYQHRDQDVRSRVQEYQSKQPDVFLHSKDFAAHFLLKWSKVVIANKIVFRTSMGEFTFDRDKNYEALRDFLDRLDGAEGVEI
jgi:hypothetical protein